MNWSDGLAATQNRLPFSAYNFFLLLLLSGLFALTHKHTVSFRVCSCLFFAYIVV